MGKYKQSWFAEGKMANRRGDFKNERMAGREAWAESNRGYGIWKPYFGFAAATPAA